MAIHLQKSYLESAGDRIEGMRKALGSFESDLVDAELYIMSEECNVEGLIKTAINRRQVVETLEVIADKRYCINYIEDVEKTFIDEDRQELVLFQLVSLIELGHLKKYRKVKFLEGGQAHILTLEFPDFEKKYEIQEVKRNSISCSKWDVELDNFILPNFDIERAEHQYFIKHLDSHSSNTLIKFCPWCGSELDGSGCTKK